ncbi:hypothetical protein GCM10009555_061840 [Acrocarpospora macrocephala]|uniref:Uncharacterized protein n=1 Tax=Acrocarpospora macrocephala TaxID=150177 RepID=A0A5M3WKB2_9ACTN|nr:hypothetical protein Amac_032230 [Acrocarpospora macrocephala]
MVVLAGSRLAFVSLLYLSIIRIGQFLLLRLRTDTSKDVEIIVLRHQLACAARKRKLGV